MRVDTNTQGHRQWYYFSVKNKKPIKVKFNILRFNKSLSLYQRGMKPYILSKKQFEETGNHKFTQQGKNVKYKLQSNAFQKKKKYILSFQYQFKYQYDQVYFAACPPYSYTYLNHQLQTFKQKSLSLGISFEIQQLNKSVCGLSIPLVTIQNKNKHQKHKKFIVISGRAHPGQTSGSWVIDGLLQQLIDIAQNNSVYQNVIFKIIPMVNPDGVFVGNYRTGIVGMDFNRKYNSGNNKLFPEIQGLKMLMEQLQTEGQIISYFDMHGHSILRNSFIFGPDLQNFQNNQLILFPQKIEEKSRIFKRDNCRFKNQKQKIQTARVYFQFKLGILSFTIQNSLGLYYNQFHTMPLQTSDWRTFGKQIVTAIAQLIQQSAKQKYDEISKKKIIKQWKNDRLSINQMSNKKSIQSIEKKNLSPQNKTFKIKNHHLVKFRQYKQNKSKIFLDLQSHPSSNLNKSSTIQIPFSKYRSQKLNEENPTTPSQKDEKTLTKLYVNSQKIIYQQQNQNMDNLSEHFNQDINDQDSDGQNLNQQYLIDIVDAIEKQNQQELQKDKINKQKCSKSQAKQIGLLQGYKIIKSSKDQLYANTLTTIGGFRQLQFLPKKISTANKNDIHYQKYKNYRKKKQKQRKQKQILLRLEKPGELLNSSKHAKQLRRYMNFNYQTNKIEQNTMEKFVTIHGKPIQKPIIDRRRNITAHQKLTFEMTGKIQSNKKLILERQGG